MSLGPVMVGVASYELDATEREMLLHPMVGAVILFTRNYNNIEQLQKLVEDIHNLREPKLLVCVDHEGGRVQRFRESFSAIPPAGCYGDIYDQDHARGRRLAETAGWLMAVELRAVGIDFSFAPVLDLNFGRSQVIGDRSFHRQPNAVAELAQSFMHGMSTAGMAATGKHFPGHGAVEVDTHAAIAQDERRYADIEQEDLIPFRRMIDNGLAAVMPAHVMYPNVDANPAGFSRFWLQEVLRRRLKFQGVIFSDDLLMEGAAVAGSVADRAEAALAAGCDMALVCNDFNAMCEVLDRVQSFDNPTSHLRLTRMKGRHPITRAQLHSDPRWKVALNALNICEQGKLRDLL